MGGCRDQNTTDVAKLGEEGKKKEKIEVPSSHKDQGGKCISVSEKWLLETMRRENQRRQSQRWLLKHNQHGTQASFAPSSAPNYL